MIIPGKLSPVNSDIRLEILMEPPARNPTKTLMLPWFKNNPQNILICFLIVLFAAFIAVMFSETVETCIGRLLGLSGRDGIKNGILTFLGLSMGGVLLALQAVIANIRAKAMEDAAREQAKANENTEKGQRQERLKDAIEHLGHNSASVRLGGAYELFHLAQDTKELRQTALDILCAHIRQATSDKKYQEDHKSKPSEETQSLLNLLFVQEHEIFEDFHINLQGSWLNGVNLRGARLEKAVLIKAHLHEVDLFEADLYEADLEGAYLCGAKLIGANLQKADLEEANLYQADLTNIRLQAANLVNAQLRDAKLGGGLLQGANFGKAQLQGTDLSWTQLQGADFSDTWLQKANLFSAKMQGANIEFAQLQCVDLQLADLQGANLSKVQLQGAELVGTQLEGITSQFSGSSSFETRIRDRIGEQSDLSGVTFEGGIKAEDLDSIVEGLPDDAAKELRTKLNPDVDKPASHELPQDSGAITGAYTEEEAERWVTEYKEAMSDVPGEGDS